MTYDTINDAVTIPGKGEGTPLAGRYRVVRQLGQGGMGSVWLAEDTQLDNKPFAIKMLPSILVSNKRAYNQLKAEALVAMQLVHPNIVQIRAFEENNGNPFLVMDYIDGQTLDDYLVDYGSRVERVDRVDGIGGARRPAEPVGSRVPRDRDGRARSPSGPPGGLSEADVLRILRPIAAALDYAHSKGVVHRDVKPGNVMIAKDGTPYILDFGIAREIQETITRVTGKLSSGTLLYMSPEQNNGDEPTAAQDIYSFAAMAYECLAGRPPFTRGNIEDQIKNKIPDPPPGGTQLVASVMAGLAKKPGDRPPTCAAVLEGNGTSRVERVETVGARIPVLRSVSEGVPRAPTVEPQPSAIGKSGSPSMPSPQEQGAFSHKESKKMQSVTSRVHSQGGAWKVLLAMVVLGLVIAGGWSILASTKQASTKQVALNQGKVQLWAGGPYWADRNIGAEKPWEYGYYFWWGDTVGYKYKNGVWVASDGSVSNFSFNEKNAPTYGKDKDALKSEGLITYGVLVPKHDAAQVQWGKGWRMPTDQELRDLCNKCEWTWTEMNGVNGYVVRGRGDYTSAYIFLPCAGYGDGTSLSRVGSRGYYWSSDQCSGYNCAYHLYFHSSFYGTHYYGRYNGQSVRPVQGFAK